jgi:site-specific recombinase
MSNFRSVLDSIEKMAPFVLSAAFSLVPSLFFCSSIISTIFENLFNAMQSTLKETIIELEKLQFIASSRINSGD